jgi:hypothetical protein
MRLPRPVRAGCIQRKPLGSGLKTFVLIISLGEGQKPSDYSNPLTAFGILDICMTEGLCKYTIPAAGLDE